MNNQRTEHFTKLDFNSQENLSTLKNIEERVLWLSTRMIDWANRRDDTDRKVGRQQASSETMVILLFFKKSSTFEIFSGILNFLGTAFSIIFGV